MLPYLSSVWTGHHLKPLTEELREEIHNVETKNRQQFIPVFLAGHNSIVFSADALPPSVEADLAKLKNGGIFVTSKDGEISEVFLSRLSHAQTVRFLLKDSNFLSLVAVDDSIKVWIPPCAEA